MMNFRISDRDSSLVTDSEDDKVCNGGHISFHTPGNVQRQHKS